MLRVSGFITALLVFLTRLILRRKAAFVGVKGRKSARERGARRMPKTYGRRCSVGGKKYPRDMDVGQMLWVAGVWLKEWSPVIAGLAPVATFGVVMVAFRAYQQRLEADRRSEWWKRAQWAIDASFNEDPQRRLTGLVILNELRASSLATAEDQKLFGVVAESIREEELDTDEVAVDTENETGGDQDGDASTQDNS